MVKIWAEGRELLGAEPTWRGSVDDVQKGGRVYFSTLTELCDYLSRRSGMASCADNGSVRAAPARRRATTRRPGPAAQP